MKFSITPILFFVFGSIVFSQKPYHGAEYRTIENHQYGRFEVRMKSAFGSGIVSSFFTIKDYWAEGLNGTANWREIDFETLGQHTNKSQWKPCLFVLKWRCRPLRKRDISKEISNIKKGF